MFVKKGKLLKINYLVELEKINRYTDNKHKEAITWLLNLLNITAKFLSNHIRLFSIF